MAQSFKEGHRRFPFMTITNSAVLSHIKPLFTHHELLVAWIYRIIRARYQQSILGSLWAIVQPIAAAIIFSVIFTIFVPVNTGNIPYIIFSYTAMVPWVMFTGSITDMVDSMIINMDLVSKIYFPREILVIAALMARLVDFTIAGIILILLIIFFQVPQIMAAWLFLPIILVSQLALALGIGLIGSALNVFYRDIRHLVTLGLQIWLYATPIIYPISAVPEKVRPFYFLNPMAGIIEGYRAVLLHASYPGSSLLISISIALLFLVFGYWFFKRVEHQFADVV
jgi:lipopolysaccharide transport system permease protein